MKTERQPDISHKNVASDPGDILLTDKAGGVFQDELIYKHSAHRLHPPEIPDEVVLRGDAVRLPFSYEYVDISSTRRVCDNYLELIRQNIRPPTNTTGLEAEATIIQGGKLARGVFNRAGPLSSNVRPELMESTLEIATGMNNGSHLQGPVEVARALGKAILEGVQIAEHLGGKFVWASNPEIPGKQTNTNHPYLNRFAPVVKRKAYEEIGDIPKETIKIISETGIPVKTMLSDKTDKLDWPDLGSHVHFGLPVDEEGNVDPRIALVTSHIRLSPFANIMRAALSSSRHRYGLEHDVRDVRSLTRRVLPSARNTEMPGNYPAYFNQAIRAVISGDAPDISRFTGGHDRARITPKKTGEEIGTPASDPRSQLASALFQEIIQTIAVGTLACCHGSERAAIQHLDNTYGGLLTAIPGIGANSDHGWWVKFNSKGYRDPQIEEQTRCAIAIIERVGNEYKLLSTSSKIVNHVISTSAQNPANDNLAGRLGINSQGSYDPRIKPSGIITDYKIGVNPVDMVDIQHLAAKEQAEALTKIITEDDLLEFFGL